MTASSVVPGTNALSCGIGYAGGQTGAMASRMADRCDGEWNGVYACDGEWDGGYVAMRWRLG